ncbi:hypothetical protein [Arthrobacter sp. HLT1-20]
MTEMPRYNPAPDSFTPAPAPTAPPIMNTIFFMLLGAAALHVVATIFGVIKVFSSSFRTQVEQQLRSQNIPGLTPEMIDTTIMFALTTSIVIGVAAVVAYVVIGLFLKQGRGWARMVGGVLAIVSLTQLNGLSLPSGIATILQVLLGMAAMVLCFTGPAGAFFTAKRNYKLANKTR